MVSALYEYVGTAYLLYGPITGSVDLSSAAVEFTGGGDLTGMGVTSGPRIKEILNRLRQARLDGEVSSKREEERLVEGWEDEWR